MKQQVTSSSAARNNKLIPVVICLALTVLTVAAFWQLKNCGFVNFDDQLYVYENAYVQSGLSWDSLKQAFSSELVVVSSNWHPLTWLSLMLDYSIFGLNPAGFHLINLLFHVLNTILLFLILRRMTKSLWPSAFVAALLAIHPLHVESVAWIAERKDVLSTFFWMLTMGAYSYYVEHREFKRYIFVLLFFVLGLMSKPMLVTLPFVLLLLDYWPLRRFTERKPAAPEFNWSLIYPLLLEKVPFFALAILSSIATYLAQQKAGAVSSLEALTPFVRIGNALISYVVYMGKMILPVNLAVFYPFHGELILWQVLGSGLVLIVITAAVFRMVKRFPYLATGWFWYLGTLVPVIGIVQAGAQAMADRYTYIPLIGLFIIMAWGVPDLLKKWNHRKEILLTLSALSILGLSIMTWIQVGYWQNSITLFNHTLKVTDHNYRAHNMRGNAYYDLGDYKKAMEDYDRALQIAPRYAEAYGSRGIAYHILGNYRKAIEDLNRAIEIKPGFATAYNNRGSAYNVLGNHRQAIEDYGRAIESKPGYAEAYYNRGTAYNSLGNYGQALADLSRAIESKPDYPEAYINRGFSYKGLGNYRQAVEDYGHAIAIKPDYSYAYLNRSAAYVSLGNNDLAVHDLKTAAKLGNEHAKNILKRKGINW